jgi:hypothetical protein
MSGKNIAAFGIYLDQVTVREAVDELKRIGFRSGDISTLLPDNIDHRPTNARQDSSDIITE